MGPIQQLAHFNSTALNFLRVLLDLQAPRVLRGLKGRPVMLGL
jgi:hypothetical protein